MAFYCLTTSCYTDLVIPCSDCYLHLGRHGVLTHILNSNIVSVDHCSFHIGTVASSRAVLPVGSIVYNYTMCLCIYLPVVIDNLHGRKQMENL